MAAAKAESDRIGSHAPSARGRPRSPQRPAAARARGGGGSVRQAADAERGSGSRQAGQRLDQLPVRHARPPGHGRLQAARRHRLRRPRAARPVYASAAASVVEAGYSGAWGNRVVVDHGLSAATASPRLQTTDDLVGARARCARGELSATSARPGYSTAATCTSACTSTGTPSTDGSSLASRPSRGRSRSRAQGPDRISPGRTLAHARAVRRPCRAAAIVGRRARLRRWRGDRGRRRPGRPPVPARACAGRPSPRPASSTRRPTASPPERARGPWTGRLERAAVRGHARRDR
jgi:hypothetical protein